MFELDSHLDFEWALYGTHAPTDLSSRVSTVAIKSNRKHRY